MLDLDSSQHDAIRFGAVITAAQVQLSRGTGAQVDDLIIDLGHGDRLTVQYYFYSADYQVDDMVFADGTTWGVADVMGKVVQQGTAGDDQCYVVRDNANRMNGSGGNDDLRGGASTETRNAVMATTSARAGDSDGCA